jgi:hypothetical protein
MSQHGVTATCLLAHVTGHAMYFPVLNVGCWMIRSRPFVMQSMCRVRVVIYRLQMAQKMYDMEIVCYFASVIFLAASRPTVPEEQTTIIL